MIQDIHERTGAFPMVAETKPMLPVDGSSVEGIMKTALHKLLKETDPMYMPPMHMPLLSAQAPRSATTTQYVTQEVAAAAPRTVISSTAAPPAAPQNTMIWSSLPNLQQPTGPQVARGRPAFAFGAGGMGGGGVQQVHLGTYVEGKGYKE